MSREKAYTTPDFPLEVIPSEAGSGEDQDYEEVSEQESELSAKNLTPNETPKEVPESVDVSPQIEAAQAFFRASDQQAYTHYLVNQDRLKDKLEAYALGDKTGEVDIAYLSELARLLSENEKLDGSGAGYPIDLTPETIEHIKNNPKDPEQKALEDEIGANMAENARSLFEEYQVKNEALRILTSNGELVDTQEQEYLSEIYRQFQEKSEILERYQNNKNSIESGLVSEAITTYNNKTRFDLIKSGLLLVSNKEGKPLDLASVDDGALIKMIKADELVDSNHLVLTGPKEPVFSRNEKPEEVDALKEGNEKKGYFDKLEDTFNVIDGKTGREKKKSLKELSAFLGEGDIAEQRANTLFEIMKNGLTVHDSEGRATKVTLQDLTHRLQVESRRVIGQAASTAGLSSELIAVPAAEKLVRQIVDAEMLRSKDETETKKYVLSKTGKKTMAEAHKQTYRELAKGKIPKVSTYNFKPKELDLSGVLNESLSLGFADYARRAALSPEVAQVLESGIVGEKVASIAEIVKQIKSLPSDKLPQSIFEFANNPDAYPEFFSGVESVISEFVKDTYGQNPEEVAEDLIPGEASIIFKELLTPRAFDAFRFDKKTYKNPEAYLASISKLKNKIKDKIKNDKLTLTQEQKSALSNILDTAQIEKQTIALDLADRGWSKEQTEEFLKQFEERYVRGNKISSYGWYLPQRQRVTIEEALKIPTQESLPVTENVPGENIQDMTDEEIVDEYFTYKDVVGEEQLKAMLVAVNKNKNSKIHAAALRDYYKKYTTAEASKLINDVFSDYEELSVALGLDNTSVSHYGKSPTWVTWDVAKQYKDVQYFMRENKLKTIEEFKQKKAEREVEGKPLVNMNGYRVDVPESKQEEMVNRHIGWTLLEAYQKATDEQTKEELYNSVVEKLADSEEFKTKFTELKSKTKIKSSEYAELGATLRAGLPKKLESNINEEAEDVSADADNEAVTENVEEGDSEDSATERGDEEVNDETTPEPENNNAEIKNPLKPQMETPEDNAETVETESAKDRLDLRGRIELIESDSTLESEYREALKDSLEGVLELNDIDFELVLKATGLLLQKYNLMKSESYGINTARVLSSYITKALELNNNPETAAQKIFTDLEELSNLMNVSQEEKIKIVEAGNILQDIIREKVTFSNDTEASNITEVQPETVGDLEKK